MKKYEIVENWVKKGFESGLFLWVEYLAFQAARSTKPAAETQQRMTTTASAPSMIMAP